MISLDDSLWKGLKGGYKTIYDVSIPLKQLESTTDNHEINAIVEDLWNELHHQGDVDVASYLAVPQLVRISKLRRLFDWNILALCSTIEQQRHLGNNPPLPIEYKDYYENGLTELKLFVITNLTLINDEITLRTALSALAVCNREIKLSKAILELSEDVIDEFLEKL